MKQNKHKIREYKIGDIIYPNLKALAEAAGISYDAAAQRKHRGFSDTEIFYGRKRLPIDMLSQSTIKDQTIIIDNVEYLNLSHAYNILKSDVDLSNIYNRLRIGWTLEEAFGIIVRTDKKTWIINEIQFNTLIEAYNFFKPKASFNTVRQRLKQGWALEQALEVVKKEDGRKIKTCRVNVKKERKQHKDIIVNGVKFDSIATLAKAYGVDKRLVYNRICLNRWSYERAVTEPVSVKVIVQGVEYKNAYTAWEEVGKTTKGQFEYRKSKGLPLEVCLGLKSI